MIEFKYMGELRFANVFLSHSDVSAINVHLIGRPGQAQGKITLSRTEEGFVLSKDSPCVPTPLLATIIAAIENHTRF